MYNARLMDAMPWLEGITVTMPETLARVDFAYTEKREPKLAYS